MFKGLVESLRSRLMPTYFVEVLRWAFTLIMIFGGIICGLLLAAPKLRKNVAFIGKFADNMQPFLPVIAAATAVSSFVRLFWCPGTPFVEDMLPGLLGTGAGVILFIDWLKAKQAGVGPKPAPLLPENVAMGIGIATSAIAFIHMFVGWHAPVL